MEQDKVTAVAFAAAGHACALPVGQVQQVLHVPRLCRPPGLPEPLEGFFDLGGRTVPVLCLGRLWGGEAVPVRLYTPVLVLRGAKAPGLMVESLEGCLTLEAGDCKPVEPGRAFNDCVEAETRVDGRTLFLLDPRRLLLEEERRRLEALRQEGGRRLAAWEGGHADRS